MLGAIIGDMVGSVYEFNNKRTKNISLYDDSYFLTDDSIMTLAVCECLLNGTVYDEERVVETLKKWGRAYPNLSYGISFSNWLFTNTNSPYNSFGNGAAMRISAAGWYGRNEEEVKDLSYRLTSVTHNHPEGIKGAEVTAMCVYYARIGKSKEFIKDYVSKYYNLDFEYEDLKKNYHFNETCQETVPQAIYCFLISKDFEDCVKTTISIGGDCDTTAAISCAIAEAYYKFIDPNLVREVIKKLPKPKNGCDSKNILLRFFSDKTYYNSEDEEIQNDSYLLGIEYLQEDEKYIEFIHSKSLQAIAERFVFHEIDYHFDAGEEQFSDECLADLNLEAYFEQLRLCWCSNEPFDTVEKIVREMLYCSDFESFSKMFEELTKLSNSFYSTSEVKSILKMFQNSKEAYEYLEQNYKINNSIYNEIFTKSYKRKGNNICVKLKK